MNDQIFKQLDRIEAKLDKQIERVSAAEEAIRWMKGSIKLTISLIIAATGSIISFFYKH